MKIQTLRNRSQTTQVILPDGLGEMTVTYRPTTKEIQDQYVAHIRDSSKTLIDRMAADLAITIVEWDMTDDDGPVPPTLENLILLDGQILNSISKAITEHMYPPKKASENSVAGS